MKKLLALAAVASVTVFAAPAFAETSASIGWSQFAISDLDLDAVTGHYTWTQGHFGVEVEGAFGMGDDKANVGTVNETVVAVRSVIGLFAVGQIDIADNFTLFGRVGLANVNVTERTRFINAPQTHVDENAGGSAYGVGGMWWYGDNNGVRVEYTRYNVDLGRNVAVVGNNASFSDEDPDAYTISFVHKFGAKGAAPAP